MGDQRDDGQIAGSRCFEAGFMLDREAASSLWRAACRYWTRDVSAGASDLTSANNYRP